MIFPKLELENKIQVSDKTRLDGSKSFVTVVEPEAAAGYIDVTTNKRLDWAYSTSGAKAVTIRVTTDGAPVTTTQNIEAITEADDNLFSSDPMLVELEDDILKYIRKGRSSFLDKHRAAQTMILDHLDANRIWKRDNSRYVAGDLVDIQDFKEWSRYLTMRLICESLSNEVGDIWNTKAINYDSMETRAKKRATLRLDSDADGEIDSSELEDIFSTRLVRR
jgi:hypothetical protein